MRQDIINTTTPHCIGVQKANRKGTKSWKGRNKRHYCIDRMLKRMSENLLELMCEIKDCWLQCYHSKIVFLCTNNILNYILKITFTIVF